MSWKIPSRVKSGPCIRIYLRRVIFSFFGCCRLSDGPNIALVSKIISSRRSAFASILRFAWPTGASIATNIVWPFSNSASFYGLLHSRYFISTHHWKLAINFGGRKMCRPSKPNHTANFFSLPNFQCYHCCSSIYPMNNMWLTVACHHYHKCYLLPKNKCFVIQKVTG